MAYMESQMDGETSLKYIGSQLVGAILAVQWAKYMKKY
jgi:hypothetical protein